MHTVKEWKARLRPDYREAIEELGRCFSDEREVLSPREVVDTIVNYKGGIASGYEVVCLVNEVWGIHLPTEALWKE